MVVLLALIMLQSPSPFVQPKQPVIKNSASSSAANAATENSTSKLPPAQSQNAGIPSAKHPTDNKGNEDKKTTDRIYKVDVVSPPAKPLDTPLFPVYLLLTGIGVFANLWIAFLIFRQSKLIRSEISIMQQQAHNAAEQVIAAQCANNRISHQIRLMQSANEQTNRLIEETRISADAAKKSADAIVNSERGWLLVSIVNGVRNSIFTSYGARKNCSSYSWFVTNRGKTPAIICGAKAHFRIVSGTELEAMKSGPAQYGEIETYTKNATIVAPEKNHHMAPVPLEREPTEEERKLIRKREELFFVVYGIVQYRDVLTLSTVHESRFIAVNEPGENIDAFARFGEWGEYSGHT